MYSIGYIAVFNNTLYMYDIHMIHIMHIHTCYFTAICNALFQSVPLYMPVTDVCYAQTHYYYYRVLLSTYF